MKRSHSSSSSSRSAGKPAKRSAKRSSSSSNSAEQPPQQSLKRATKRLKEAGNALEAMLKTSGLAESRSSSSSSATSDAQPTQQPSDNSVCDATNKKKPRGRKRAEAHASDESSSLHSSSRASQRKKPRGRERADTNASDESYSSYSSSSSEQNAEHERDLTAPEQVDSHAQCALNPLSVKEAAIQIEYIAIPSMSFETSEVSRQLAVQALQESVTREIDIINMTFAKPEDIESMWETLKKAMVRSAEQPAYTYHKKHRLLTVYSTKYGHPEEQQNLDGEGLTALGLSFATPTGKLTNIHGALSSAPKGVINRRLDAYLAPPLEDAKCLRFVGGPLGPGMCIQVYAGTKGYEYHSIPNYAPCAGIHFTEDLHHVLGDTSVLVKTSGQSPGVYYMTTQHSIANGLLIQIPQKQTAELTSAATTATTLATASAASGDVHPAHDEAEPSESASQETPEEAAQSETHATNTPKDKPLAVLKPRSELPRSKRAKLTPRKEARLERTTPLWLKFMPMMENATVFLSGRFILAFINSKLFHGELRSRDSTGRFLIHRMTMGEKMEFLLEKALEKREACLSKARAEIGPEIDSKTYEIPESIMREMSK